MEGIMSKKAWSLFVALGVGLVFTASVFAQEPFYKGKTVRIIVGFSPGGGYDTYSRLIARHIGRHVPGNPTFIVENMTGAGSLIAANYVYKVARPDGLSIGHFIGGLFVQQLLGKPGIEFDGRKFEYIGAPAQDSYAIGLSQSSGIRSMEQWMASKTLVKVGGTAPGSATDDVPKILLATIGLPVQVVSGYRGTADIRLAFNKGEVHGVCNAWESFKATWRAEQESGQLIVVLQTTPKAHPDLPNVPLAINFARTVETRKLIQAAVHTIGPTARPYVLPPGTPRERVQLLRKAFMDTLKDPEFLAEAQKAKLDINSEDGDELERNVKEVFNLEPALIARLKEILFGK